MEALAKRISQAYTTTTSISELAQQYLAYSRAKRAKKTCTTRTTHINQFVEFCHRQEINDFATLNTQVLDIYLDEYKKTHALTTVSAARQILKSFMLWVKHYKEVDTNVNIQAISTIKLPKSLPRYIDSEIIEKVLNSPLIDPQTRLMIKLMAKAGLRISEMVQVKLEHITGDMLLVNGKGDNERTVYLPGDLIKMIHAFADLYLIQPDDFLIRSKKGDMLTPKAAWERIKTAFKLVAGIEMTPHRLRHSYAIELLINGCDIVSIQKTLGHTDLKTTQIYLNISDDIMKSQIRNVLG